MEKGKLVLVIALAFLAGAAFVFFLTRLPSQHESVDQHTDALRPEERSVEQVTEQAPHVENSQAPRRTLCTKAAAHQVARAYMLSQPFTPDGEISLNVDASSPFTGFVQANPESFDAEGAATRCARALGPRLVESGLRAYDPGMRDRVIERFGSDAPPGAAEQIATNMNSGATDLVSVGQELTWLAEVLPGVAGGDYQAYNTGGTWQRQQARQLVPLLTMMINQYGGKEAIQQAMRQALATYGPIYEQQIVTMATLYAD